jgi:hypothetical protein
MRVSIAVFGLLAACGGSVTSVDGNQNTSTLTPTDQDQLCLDTYNYVRTAFSNDDLAKLQCGFTNQSQDPSTCDSAYQACLVNARANVQQIQWPLVPDCTAFDANVKACNTTVAEYSKCLEQELDVVKSMETHFPLCTQAEQQSAALSAASKLSTDCLALLDTCHPSFVPGK